MSAPRHYCTYFDSNYLIQGLTLYRSLTEHDPGSVLWALCLDDAAFDALRGLDQDNLRPIALVDLESADSEVAATRELRSRVEYYFTLSPAWPAYILARFPEIERVTYVDSDLLFFSSPDPMFAEMGDDSVLVIGHRFPEHLRHLETHGRYNVGLLSFRNDDRGRNVLSRWRRQCIAWCYDRVEDGKFADQKYLDEWPHLAGVHVLGHVGAGLAPWNWMNYRLTRSANGPSVNDQPLIFFHYQGLKLIGHWLVRPSEATYDPMPGRLRRQIYGPYLRQLAASRSWLESRLPSYELPLQGSMRYTALTRRQILSGIKRGHIRPRLGHIAL